MDIYCLNSNGHSAEHAHASSAPSRYAYRQHLDRLYIRTCCQLAVVLQLKNAPNFLKVKVDAPTYKGSGGIEPSEERSKKQDQATQAYAKVEQRLQ